MELCGRRRLIGPGVRWPVVPVSADYDERSPSPSPFPSPRLCAGRSPAGRTRSANCVRHTLGTDSHLRILVSVQPNVPPSDGPMPPSN